MSKEQYIISGPLKGPAKPFVYWNKDTESWVPREKATRFTTQESLEYPLPEGSVGWVKYNPLAKNY